MRKCLACARGNHKLCLNDFCQCLHQSVEENEETRVETGKNRKNDYELKDPQSTGRKRAAKMYPLIDGAECEFAGQTNAGTIPGLKGIDGCGIRPGTIRGIQQARHHLNYNTLDNEPDNVVRICHRCHQTIHWVNDPLKDEYYAKRFGGAAARGLQKTYKKLGKGGVKEND